MTGQNKRSETASGSSTDRSVDRSRIACIGLGFVGYNSALEFCRSDRAVTGVDTNREVVTAVRNGAADVETDGLDEYVKAGDCRLTTQISEAEDCSVYVISVPTPLQEDETPDLSILRAACRDVATVLEADDLVVVQSTVYPGCTRDELLPLLEQSGLDAGADFGASHVPERYSPGNDRSKAGTRVVGSISEPWRDRTVDLYEPIADTTAPVSSLEVAEMTKLVENVQRDINIALINELAAAAEGLGIDIWEVIDGAATKWNFHRYEPGLGVGGHCLPVDPHYLQSIAEANDVEMSLLRTAREVNSSRPEQYYETIFRALDAVGKSPSATTVSMLGVTYKPDVKDVRNSPAIELVRLLRDRNISVDVYDPQFDVDEAIAGSELSNRASAIDAVRNTDVVVVATGHEPFHRFNPPALAAVMESNPILIDPQRTFDPAAVADSGLISPTEIATQQPRYRRSSTVPAERPATEQGETDD